MPLQQYILQFSLGNEVRSRFVAVVRGFAVLADLGKRDLLRRNAECYSEFGFRLLRKVQRSLDPF